MNYDDLAALAALASSLPYIPKRELRCHPSVTAILRAQSDSERYSTWVNIFGSGQPSLELLEIPIHEDPEMFLFTWEIYEDGVIVASGTVL